MAANQKLADDVWTYEDVSPPNVVDLLSQITDFLTAIGYQKSAKALQKEAKGDGFEIDLKEWSKKVEGGDATGLTQLWHDWKATKGSQEETADDSSSGSDSDSSSSSSDSDSDSDSDSSSDAEDGALVEVKAEVTSDDSSDSDSSSSSEDEKPAAKTGAKRKRSATPSSSSGSDSSSDEEMAEAGNASDSSSGSSSSDSSSSDSDARPAKKAKITRKKAASPSSVSSSDSSSSSSSSDSSSSSESEASPSPKEKAKKQKKTKSKPTPVKPEERSASSSATLAGTSPEPPKPIVKVEPKQAVKVEQPASTEDSSSGMHPARLARLDNTGGKFASQGAGVKKESNVPFSRIPVDQAVDPKFASNEYVPYDYAERAHRDLIVTRGKGFTKEKNKKKRGSYRGGAIDLAPKGIKFED